MTELQPGKIKLTETVKKGGCAAKVAAEELRAILSSVKFPKRLPDVMIDGSHFDDAAVFRINKNLAIVQTLDFFTPIVNDPQLFGKIAAANAISDVYAMGAIPKTCMAILAFPLATFERQTVADVLQGASEVIEKAGAGLVGGHSIDDETLKFGLSVTGFVHPDRVWTNQKAKAGDILILTKRLGTGTLCAGLKKGVYQELDIEEALQSMVQLNHVPRLLKEDLLTAIHGATDITGFGLSGHSYQMALASNVSFRIQTKSLPLFEKTLESLKAENLTKAHRTNREYTQKFIQAPSDPLLSLAIHDPQTSGGLLLSVAKEKADAVLAALQAEFTAATKVGKVVHRLGADAIVIYE